MIEWLSAAASLVTLAGVATLIGLMVHFSKEWKAAFEAKHAVELAEKDRTIKQLQAGTYSAAAEAETRMMSLIKLRDDTVKLIEEELSKTQLQEREKAELLQRLELQFSSEQRVLKAVLDLRSEDRVTRLNAARTLLKIRDPRTIPALVQTMEEEIRFTPTKFIVMKALTTFGVVAVPSLINEVREHARLVIGDSDPSEDPQSEAWRAAVLDSDAGRLLVRIGSASIPSLQELRKNEGLLGEAADVLLSAIENRQ